MVRKMNNEIIELMKNVGVHIDNQTSEEIYEDIDSLQFVALICDIEDKYGINLTDEELLLDNYENWGEFIKFIEEKISKKEFIN